MADWSQFRPQCQKEDVFYFDYAGRSALPTSVEEVGIEALKQKSKPWEGNLGGQQKETNEMRKLFAQLINAQKEDIAFCPSTAHAMSIAAENLKRLNILKENKVVVLLEHQFASSVCPFQAACDEVGGKVRVVKDTKGEGRWAEEIINAIDDEVVAVVLGNVHWRDGTYINLPLISSHLSSLSSPPLLLIDASQSVAAIPFDVEVVKPDFLCVSVHKWLLCPYGMSIMYLAKQHHQTWLPLDSHDRARKGAHEARWDEMGAMSLGGGERFPTEFEEGARRLDAGGHPNPILIPCLVHSISLILSVGVENIYKRMRHLVKEVEKGVKEEVGEWLEVRRGEGEGEERGGHYTGVVFTGSQEKKYEFHCNVRDKLKKRNIFVSLRCGRIRISPYVYVTEEEVAIFIQNLGEVVREVVKEMGL